MILLSIHYAFIKKIIVYPVLGCAGGFLEVKLLIGTVLF